MFVPQDKSSHERFMSVSQNSIWIQTPAREFGVKCMQLKHDMCEDRNCKCICHLLVMAHWTVYKQLESKIKNKTNDEMKLVFIDRLIKCTHEKSQLAQVVLGVNEVLKEAKKRF